MQSTTPQILTHVQAFTNFRREVVSHFHRVLNPMGYIVENSDIYKKYFDVVNVALKDFMPETSMLSSFANPTQGVVCNFSDTNQAAVSRHLELAHFLPLCEGLFDLGCSPPRLRDFLEYVICVSKSVSVDSLSLCALKGLLALGSTKVQEVLLHEVIRRRDDDELTLREISSALYILTYCILQERGVTHSVLPLLSLPHPTFDIMRKADENNADGISAEKRSSGQMYNLKKHSLESQNFVKIDNCILLSHHKYYASRYMTLSRVLPASSEKYMLDSRDVLIAIWSIGMGQDTPLEASWVEILEDQCRVHRKMFRAEHIASIARALYLTWKSRSANVKSFAAVWGELVSSRLFTQTNHLLSAQDLFICAITTEMALRSKDTKRSSKELLSAALVPMLTRLCELEEGYDIIKICLMALGNEEYYPKLIPSILRHLCLLASRSQQTLTSSTARRLLHVSFLRNLPIPFALISRCYEVLSYLQRKENAFPLLYLMLLSSPVDQDTHFIFEQCIADLGSSTALIDHLANLNESRQREFCENILVYIEMLSNSNQYTAFEEGIRKWIHQKVRQNKTPSK